MKKETENQLLENRCYQAATTSKVHMSDEQAPEKPTSKYTNRGGNGGPAGNKNNLKHGYYSLVRMVRNRRGALDRRTILGKMVQETAQRLEADLGGDLSTAERMLVHDVALDTLLLAALNNEVADSPPLIDGKDGLKAHPVYQLRSQLIAQRREHLKLLGIKRVAKPVNLHEILSQAAEHTNGNGEDHSAPAS